MDPITSCLNPFDTVHMDHGSHRKLGTSLARDAADMEWAVSHLAEEHSDYRWMGQARLFPIPLLILMTIGHHHEAYHPNTSSLLSSL